jgi:hypothetical protein
VLLIAGCSPSQESAPPIPDSAQRIQSIQDNPHMSPEMKKRAIEMQRSMQQTPPAAKVPKK